MTKIEDIDFAAFYKPELVSEFGCSMPIRWGGLKVTINDKEIETPLCIECGQYKQLVIGKNADAWICPYCPK